MPTPPEPPALRAARPIAVRGSASIPIPLRILGGSLAIWGLYLAIGASGQFSDRTLFQPIRSLIVASCSALFLGAWYAIYRLRQANQAATSAPAWNRASLLSIAAALGGYTSWGMAWWTWLQGSTRSLTSPLGWTAMVLFGVSLVSGLVGLSDPRGRRGQLCGLVGLVLSLLAGGLLIWQIQAYVQQHAR